MATDKPQSCAAVIIGRNEGERLKRCIASVMAGAQPVVYVDSGSTDGSTDWARSQDVEVVDLDLSQPFTASRARNAGFARALALRPDVEWVQFVDGDCEVVAGWMEAAQAFLADNPQVAVVCGRRRERHPEASIFNAQCDREWNTPIGEARACGGDAMFRRKALEQAGGYRESLIAGEEPELCIRLRAAGWRIWRLDREMTLHDAAILRWRQWWNRMRRTGHAFAEGASLHGAPPDRHWVAETRRAILWGLLLPAFILACAIPTGGLSLLLFILYPLQVLRLTLRQRPRGIAGLQQAILLVLGRFPEAAGVAGFWLTRLLNRRGQLIEYK